MKEFKCYHCENSIPFSRKVWWRMQQSILICPKCFRVSSVDMRPILIGHVLAITQLLPFIILGFAFNGTINFTWIYPVFLITILFDYSLRRKFSIVVAPKKIL